MVVGVIPVAISRKSISFRQQFRSKWPRHQLIYIWTICGRVPVSKVNRLNSPVTGSSSQPTHRVLSSVYCALEKVEDI